MADGFLGRWSKRKQEAREGLPLEEPAPVLVQTQPESNALPASVSPETPDGSPKAPLPTLEDVKALTAESDFQAFVARDVDPEVRNAAMKKLFTDPHYNVMDGLDTYIDDYSKPDPIPESMLRQLASAKFLNLFDEEKNEAPKPVAPADALPSEPAQKNAVSPATVADAPPTTNPETAPETTSTQDDHTDLRLQQDHAAGAQGSGSAAG